MKSKVKAVKILIPILLLSISIYLIVIFVDKGTKIHEAIKAIFSGVFASTLVSLFIYLGEYFAEKKRLLEAFYIDTVDNIRFINQIQVYSEESLDEMVERNDEPGIIDIINQYQKAYENLSLSKTDILLGDIGFISSINKKAIWKEIIFNTYDREREAKIALTELMRHIIEYKHQTDRDLKGNTAVLISKIKDIQHFFFKANAANIGYTTYNDCAYRINLQLHYLFQRLYGNKYNDSAPTPEDYWSGSFMVNPFTN